MGISNRGTKAKSITSCDNAFVTNILLLSLRCTHAFAQKTSVGPRPYSGAKRQQQMFFLCESEAAATNVFSVRKRSGSNKCFFCAKAKRQQQMFFLCESEAAATNVFSVRKRSGSNKCFFCAKAKRQQQSAQPERKSPPRFTEKT